MIQEILTYLVVGWAFLQVALFFYRLFFPKKNASVCGGGGCSCDVKTKLIHEIRNGKYPSILEESLNQQ